MVQVSGRNTKVYKRARFSAFYSFINSKTLFLAMVMDFIFDLEKISAESRC